MFVFVVWIIEMFVLLLLLQLFLCFFNSWPKWIWQSEISAQPTVINGRIYASGKIKNHLLFHFAWLCTWLYCNISCFGRSWLRKTATERKKKTNNRHCCHSFFYFYLSLSLDVVFIVVCITLLRQGVQQRLGYSTMHALHTANVFFLCVVRTDLSL